MALMKSPMQHSHYTVQHSLTPIAVKHRISLLPSLPLSLSLSGTEEASSHGNSSLSKLKDEYGHTHMRSTHTMFLINTSWVGDGEGALRLCSELDVWVRGLFVLQEKCQTLRLSSVSVSFSDSSCIFVYLFMCV